MTVGLTMLSTAPAARKEASAIAAYSAAIHSADFAPFRRRTSSIQPFQACSPDSPLAMATLLPKTSGWSLSAAAAR